MQFVLCHYYLKLMLCRRVRLLICLKCNFSSWNSSRLAAHAARIEPLVLLTRLLDKPTSSLVRCQAAFSQQVFISWFHISEVIHCSPLMWLRRVSRPFFPVNFLATPFSILKPGSHFCLTVYHQRLCLCIISIGLMSNSSVFFQSGSNRCVVSRLFLEMDLIDIEQQMLV